MDSEHINTHGIRSDRVLGRSPILVDHPCRLDSESGEGEPVIVLVLLEISEGDEEKAS